MSEMRQERGQMGKANGILSKSGSQSSNSPMPGYICRSKKIAGSALPLLSRSSDNSVSDAQKSRSMCGCAGTLAEDWLEVENQLQERLRLKSWQSGLTSDSQVAQTPSPTHRAPGIPGKRSNLTLSSPTVSTMVCHHLNTFEYRESCCTS